MLREEGVVRNLPPRSSSRATFLHDCVKLLVIITVPD